MKWKGLLFFVILLVLVFFLVNQTEAKDKNNLSQYDSQLVADVLSAIDDKVYPIIKLFYPSWSKLDQASAGKTITSDQRVVSIYNELFILYQILESPYTNVVNDSSCGEETTVTLYSWQVRQFGGLPGYCYFLNEKFKLKIERVALQEDGSGKINNISCTRNVTSLDGVTAGQEQYILGILSSYFPGFEWGNVVWNPDDKVLFAVEVKVLPPQYLND